jgi:hypothetical protein
MLAGFAKSFSGLIKNILADNIPAWFKKVLLVLMFYSFRLKY